MANIAERLGIATGVLTSATILIHDALARPVRDQAHSLDAEFKRFSVAEAAKQAKVH